MEYNWLSLLQWLSGKESAWSSADTGDMDWIPGSGRSSRGGNGSPLQYCLGKSRGQGSLAGHSSPGCKVKQDWEHTYIHFVHLHCSVTFRFTAKWTSYTYTYIHSFLVEKEIATSSSILAWKNPMDKGVWWAIVHGVTRVGYHLATKPLFFRRFPHVGHHRVLSRILCAFYFLKL